MKEKVADLLVRYLERRGVRHIFGLCGHTNIAVLSAMANTGLKFINVRHEQVAAHAADGYARATGKASVLLTHLGPGLTNAATGVANAALDCIPMVVIAGDIPTHYYGKHPHQEINLHADADQWEVYRPFVKRAWRVDRPDLFPEIIQKAFQLAESGQSGPVLVSVPMDIFSAGIESGAFDALTQTTRELIPASMSDATAERIVRELTEVDSPVIYAGGGVLLSRTSDALAEFADHLSVPVAHSLMGKGAIADDHPMTIGMTGFWGTQFCNDTCLGANTILALGARFKEADSSSWYPGYTFDIPPAKLIQIDIDPAEISRNYPVEIGVVADLSQAMGMLVAAARRLFPNGRNNDRLRAAITSFRKEFKQSNKANATSDAFPMMPERILADVRACLPREGYLTTDVGWNKNGVGQQFDIYTPGTIFTPGGYATMGFGPPAALGVKVAKPDSVVISLVGDGGFGQNPALLATAREERIGVVWVVMNNNAFGTIAGLQQANFGLTLGTVFPDPEARVPDYAALARSYGVEGIRIESAAEFKPALEKAIASGKPTVLDVSMINNPTPTTGHWNILDIYSPDKKMGHAAT